MPGAGLARPLADNSPIKPQDFPSRIHINVAKFQFLKNAKPEDGLSISVRAVVGSVHMDENGEHFLDAEIQEVTPQAKEEKPPEESNGIIPK